MEYLSELEGFTASQWELNCEIPEYDGEGIECWVFSYRGYDTDNKWIALELAPDGGFCVYVKWGVDYQMAFMTLEEAVCFWNQLRVE